MIVAMLLLMQSAVSPADSAAIAAVRAEAEQEPVEAFGEATGHVSIGSIEVADVDGDGYPEAFVAIEPRYQQTPTVLVYSFSAHGLRRLREALVPGRLVPASEKFLSPHGERVAVDMGVANGGSGDLTRVVPLAVEQGLSVITYRTFMHADNRNHFITVVDLSYLPLPTTDTRTCASFDFETVEAMAVGSLSGDAKRRYLVALTPTAITVYRIDRIKDEGYLEKRVWLIPRPETVAGIEKAAWGEVELRLRDGTTAPLGVK